MRLIVFRFGIAVATTVSAFVLFIILTDVTSRSHLPTTLGALLPKAGVAQARLIITPDIQTEAVLQPNLRLIHVTGHIKCDEGEMVRVEVELVQQTTGARAVGHTQAFCTGDVQTWTALVVARGANEFTPGPVTACAMAATRSRDEITDTVTWCKAITLVPR